MELLDINKRKQRKEVVDKRKKKKKKKSFDVGVQFVKVYYSIFIQ